MMGTQSEGVRPSPAASPAAHLATGMMPGPTKHPKARLHAAAPPEPHCHGATEDRGRLARGDLGTRRTWEPARVQEDEASEKGSARF